jgi:hypothetical protein
LDLDDPKRKEKLEALSKNNWKWQTVYI